MTRNYAAQLCLTYKDTTAITEVSRKICDLIFLDGHWADLEPNAPPFKIDCRKFDLIDTDSPILIDKFVSKQTGIPYYGLSGEALKEIFPEWKTKRDFLISLGFNLVVDTPCIVLTNGHLAIHRDGFKPEDRGCGMTFKLFDTSKYEIASFQQGAVNTDTPNAIWTYDSGNLNIINTALPHGTFIDPNLPPESGYLPRAVLTQGLYGTYEQAREKLNDYVIKDW